MLTYKTRTLFAWSNGQPHIKLRIAIQVPKMYPLFLVLSTTTTASENQSQLGHQTKITNKVKKVFTILKCISNSFLPTQREPVRLSLYLERYKVPPMCSLKRPSTADMQYIYRRMPMQKCDYNKVEVTLLHGCFLVNLVGYKRELNVDLVSTYRMLFY